MEAQAKEERELSKRYVYLSEEEVAKIGPPSASPMLRAPPYDKGGVRRPDTPHVERLYSWGEPGLATEGYRYIQRKSFHLEKIIQSHLVGELIPRPRPATVAGTKERFHVLEAAFREDLPYPSVYGQSGRKGNIVLLWHNGRKTETEEDRIPSAFQRWFPRGHMSAREILEDKELAAKERAAIAKARKETKFAPVAEAIVTWIDPARVWISANAEVRSMNDAA